MIKSTRTKIAVLGGVTALTVAIHYGWVLPHIFGHTAWVHAVHSRFCYLPIAIAAAWFGLRGGIITATVISLLVIPLLLTTSVDVPSEHFVSLSSELVEIFFYYVFGILIGGLVDREIAIRRRQEQTQIELERSQHLSLVGQMAAGVAHEIKNPLASIKGAMEIVTDESTSENDRKEFRTIITSEIKRIDGTVREFLEYARPRATKRERINLTDIAEGTIRQLRGQFEARNVSISFSVDREHLMLGDQDKLHQALLNLLLNAFEASPSGGAINVSICEGAYGRVSLIIQDSGTGISPDRLSRIFEPFYTTKASGSGLGLAIVKGIIEDHSGLIEVKSKGEAGTEFRLSFAEVK